MRHLRGALSGMFKSFHLVFFRLSKIAIWCRFGIVKKCHLVYNVRKASKWFCYEKKVLRNVEGMEGETG